MTLIDILSDRYEHLGVEDKSRHTVSGLVERDVDDAIALAQGTVHEVPVGYATRTESGMSYRAGSLGRADLIPNYLKVDQLYLRLFVAARRYCAGEREHLYW